VPLGDSKPQLLEKYGAYVKSLAGQVRKQFRAQYELDELIAWGQIGLLEAAERFDAKVGANFLTFAHYRIKGSIYDGLRKMGVLKGGANASERVNSLMGNMADRDMGQGSLEHDVNEISDAVTGLAVVLAATADGNDGLFDENMRADERIEIEQLKTRVHAAISQLPEKERKLLEGYYFQNKTLEEAGAEIGQSKSWSSRLHARAIETLKQLLANDDDNSSKENRRAHHGGSTGRNFSSTNSATETARPGRAGEARSKQF
jgi:RNA polymerase sigma factor FliA